MLFLILNSVQIFLSIGLTCIPPTSVFRPTFSKGLTAGFAPMPIITCKPEEKTNSQIIELLLLLKRRYNTYMLYQMIHVLNIYFFYSEILTRKITARYQRI